MDAYAHRYANPTKYTAITEGRIKYYTNEIGGRSKSFHHTNWVGGRKYERMP